MVQIKQQQEILLLLSLCPETVCIYTAVTVRALY